MKYFLCIRFNRLQTTEYIVWSRTPTIRTADQDKAKKLLTKYCIEYEDMIENDHKGCKFDIEKNYFSTGN